MTGPLLAELSGLWSAFFVSSSSECGLFLPAMVLLVLVFPFVEEGLKKDLMENGDSFDLSLSLSPHSFTHSRTHPDSTPKLNPYQIG